MTLLVMKSHGREGFEYINKSDIEEFELSDTRYFTDSRHKILIDNDPPYGHFMTNWLYHLLKQLEKFPNPEDVLVLFNKSPQESGITVHHMSTVTKYVEAKLLSKGYGVEYLDGPYFEISNIVEPLDPPLLYSQVFPPVVGPFLKEGLTTKSQDRKIYLSRSKTTTPNGNVLIDLQEDVKGPQVVADTIQELRIENQYKFSDRLDDEQRLEDYLKNLGFEILIPEDFDSYQEQLDRISEARILMSATSASLHAGMVLQPGAIVVELCTLMNIPTGSTEEFMLQNGFLHEHYRSMALAQKNPYIAISNLHRKVDEIIDFIESNPAIKAILAS